VDRRKPVHAPQYSGVLLELTLTAIVVGSALAAMFGLFDLFSMV